LDKFFEKKILSTIEERLTPTQIETPRWTAQQFERQVLDSNPKVAVFDCDGTLWSCDSGVGFLDWSLRKGLVSRSTSDWVDTRYRAYQAGGVSEPVICGEMVQIYAGLREEELRSAAGRYVRKYVQPYFFPEMLALLAKLREANVELWAVSSTNKWVISEAVRELGFTDDHILAVELRVDQGLITTEILDVPTGEGKAVSLKRVGLDHPDAVFGNSAHDLAMLKLARHAFPVNPSPVLLTAAAENGWGYFLPEAAGGLAKAVGGE
jgi:phosphoserine phosphatase